MAPMAPMAPLPAALAPWQNFYMLTGAAAATLTGLMFVALTFGSSLVTKETTATTRAFLDPTYGHFVHVLITSCLLTVPILDGAFLGGVLVTIGGFRLWRLFWVFRRYQEAQRKSGDIELSDWMLSIVIPLFCYVVLLATGVGFVVGAPAALTGLATVTLVLLAIGIHSAWELFVWMAVAVSERRRSGE